MKSSERSNHQNLRIIKIGLKLKIPSLCCKNSDLKNELRHLIYGRVITMQPAI